MTHRHILLVIIAAVIGFALGARSAGAATLEGAPPIEWDEGLSQRQEQAVSLYVETKWCMVDAGRAFLRKGVRQPQAIIYFISKACGDTFARQLMRDGMKEENARQMVADMATRTLYHDILGQAIPRSGPAASAPIQPKD